MEQISLHPVLRGGEPAPGEFVGDEPIPVGRVVGVDLERGVDQMGVGPVPLGCRIASPLVVGLPGDPQHAARHRDRHPHGGGGCGQFTNELAQHDARDLRARLNRAVLRAGRSRMDRLAWTSRWRGRRGAHPRLPGHHRVAVDQRLGHDRDQPGCHHLPRRHRARRVQPRAAAGTAGHVRVGHPPHRDPHHRRRRGAKRPGTAAHPVNCRSAAPLSRRGTSARTPPRTRSPRTGGCAPVTWPPSTATARCASWTAPRTS